jgi:phage/plasmid-associated DNA primase
MTTKGDLMSDEMQWIEERLETLAGEDNYKRWREVTLALKQVCGDDVFGAWDMWSQKSVKYDAVQNLDIWEKIKVNEKHYDKSLKFLEELFAPVEERGIVVAEGAPLTPDDVMALYIKCRDIMIEEELGLMPYDFFEKLLNNYPVEIQGSFATTIAAALIDGQLKLNPHVNCYSVKGHVWVYRDEDKKWYGLTYEMLQWIVQTWTGRVITGYKKVKEKTIVQFYKGTNSDLIPFFKRQVADRPNYSKNHIGKVFLKDEYVTINEKTQMIEQGDTKAEHLVLSSFDYTWKDIQGKDAPKFVEYLYGLFEGGEKEVQAKKVEWIKRFIGLTLFSLGTKMQMPALILSGEAGTGKSTLAKLISKIMPENSYSTVCLSEMGDEKARYKLQGARFNWRNELPKSKMGGADHIKAIIFGEEIEGRALYKNGERFCPIASHLFCSNHLPSIRDADEALMNRFAFLHITGQPVRYTSKQNHRFVEDLLEEEQAGIIYTCIEAARRACVDHAQNTPDTINGFPVVEESQEQADEVMEMSDYGSQFLNEACIIDPSLKAEYSCSILTLYRFFREWLKECEGVSERYIPNKKAFVQSIKRKIKAKKVKGQDATRAVGIRVNLDVYNDVKRLSRNPQDVPDVNIQDSRHLTSKINIYKTSNDQQVSNLKPLEEYELCTVEDVEGEMKRIVKG